MPVLSDAIYQMMMKSSDSNMYNRCSTLWTTTTLLFKIYLYSFVAREGRLAMPILSDATYQKTMKTKETGEQTAVPILSDNMPMDCAENKADSIQP